MRLDRKKPKMNLKGTIILFTLFAATFLLTIAPAIVGAHAPGSVTLSYNSATQTLTVTVVHQTGSPNSHYIKKVEIKKNGKSADTYNYQSQPDPSEFSYTYNIPAKMGDKLEVTASCSIFGSKTATLIVQKQLS